MGIKRTIIGLCLFGYGFFWMVLTSSLVGEGNIPQDGQLEVRMQFMRGLFSAFVGIFLAFLGTKARIQYKKLLKCAKKMIKDNNLQKVDEIALVEISRKTNLSVPKITKLSKKLPKEILTSLDFKTAWDIPDTKSVDLKPKSVDSEGKYYSDSSDDDNYTTKKPPETCTHCDGHGLVAGYDRCNHCYGGYIFK